MNPCIAGPARYMYIMAEDGNFPKYFGKVHPKYKSPYRAIVLCGILGVFFILSGSIKIVAMMCSYNQIQAYIIGFASFLGLRKKEPDLKRPWKCPAGTFGAWFSIIMLCDPADPGIRSSCYLVQHHLGRTGYPVLRNLRSQETDPAGSCRRRSSGTCYC